MISNFEPTAKRTHCKYGHEYTKKNTAFSNGHRICITCRARCEAITKKRAASKSRKAKTDADAMEQAVAEFIEARKSYGRMVAGQVSAGLEAQ